MVKRKCSNNLEQKIICEFLIGRVQGMTGAPAPLGQSATSSLEHRGEEESCYEDEDEDNDEGAIGEREDDSAGAGKDGDNGGEGQDIEEYRSGTTLVILTQASIRLLSDEDRPSSTVNSY